MGAEVLAWSFTSGWASGINAYAVVLVMGLMDRFWQIGEIPEVLARPDVLIVAGVLFLLESVADKIPYLDSAWDAIHLGVRPVVGAALGYLIGHEQSTSLAAALAATGGVTALLAHLTKSGVRAGVNLSPEPVSNTVVSGAEDVTVVAVLGLAAAFPLVAAGIAGLLLLAGIIVGLMVMRAAARLRRRHAPGRVRVEQERSG
ncbi:DUF4126 domain-containing protein [Mobilicoccus caccae]|uniref:DUF4126 domain-containing protein n=1 Tax=Mobilicoccus caccae TaxID=1859295 RepID=A0ABQ6IWX7_9MICO|nr:DUF4126 domain-containing protein [Mobilicoccus caccae]GMA41242.1 hypothetical protein GCM10025883_32870 [Mobilicoccus caccae]